MGIPVERKVGSKYEGGFDRPEWTSRNKYLQKLQFFLKSLKNIDTTYLVERGPGPVAVVWLEEPREGDLVAAAARRREDPAVRLHRTLELAPAIMMGKDWSLPGFRVK